MTRSWRRHSPRTTYAPGKLCRSGYFHGSGGRPVRSRPCTGVRSCLVDSDVTFVEDELVDHYGNVDRGVYGTPTGPTDLQTKIFWLPESDGGWMAEAEGEELPTWVEDAVAAWHAQAGAEGQAKL